ncbi:MAG: TlpA disulfide reductase family protein [Emticicia sp.]|nr:TlpA disulfide reductase family protein [Emticicia sp.]
MIQRHKEVESMKIVVSEDTDNGIENNKSSLSVSLLSVSLLSVSSLTIRSHYLKTWGFCAFATLCLLDTFAQKTLPDVVVKDLQGQNISTKQFGESSQPTIISFWATWCKPCLQEINAINENLADWKIENKVRFIAISVDDSRSKGRVPTLVNSKKWKFEVYIDENGDFQRALNVLNVPHTFVLDAQGKIIYQHTSYALGDEETYIEAIRKIK